MKDKERGCDDPQFVCSECLHEDEGQDGVSTPSGCCTQRGCKDIHEDERRGERMRLSLSCSLAKICMPTKTKDKVECQFLLGVLLREGAFAGEDLHASTEMNDGERGCNHP